MASIFLLNDVALPPALRGLEAFLQSLSPLTSVALGLLLMVAAAGVVRLLAQGHRLREKRRTDSEFFENFQLAEQPLELYLARRMHPRSPCFRAYESGCRELCLHLTGAFTVNPELINRLRTAGRITPSQMLAVRRTVDHAGETWLSSVHLHAGVLTLQMLPLLGLAGTLGVWMEDSWKLHAFSFYPGLLPLTAALVLMLPLLLWRSLQTVAIHEASRRVRHLAAVWTRDVERWFVDHRKPLDTLPSLDHMEVLDKPTFSHSPADL